MAGHSKWATIQRNGALDRNRGKVFNKLIRELTTAASSAGSDPQSNTRLRLAMDRAHAASMPPDTIERAVERGSAEAGTENFSHVRYEGYGPGGVAVMVDCLTDNRNRTVSDVRRAFSHHGGNLGADGSVGYLFHPMGCLNFAPGASAERILTAAFDAGAEDVVRHADGSVEVLTDPVDYERVREAMTRAGLSPADSAVTMRASTSAPLVGDAAESMFKMLEALEDLDDVQNVYSNADIPDEILARV